MRICFVAAQSEQEALRCASKAHPQAQDAEIAQRVEFTELLNFELPQRIRKMREAQNLYFRSRGNQQLAAAKSAEKEVDKWLAAFGQESAKSPEVVQPKLF